MSIATRLSILGCQLFPFNSLNMLTLFLPSIFYHFCCEVIPEAYHCYFDSTLYFMSLPFMLLSFFVFGFQRDFSMICLIWLSLFLSWIFLSFLNLQDYILHLFGKITGHCLFDCCFCHIFLFLSRISVILTLFHVPFSYYTLICFFPHHLFSVCFCF